MPEWSDHQGATDSVASERNDGTRDQVAPGPRASSSNGEANMDRDDRDIMLHEAMVVVVHTGRARRRGSFRLWRVVDAAEVEIHVLQRRGVIFTVFVDKGSVFC